MQEVWELRSHMPHGQKIKNKKQKQCCNKFNKDFKYGPHLKKKKENKKELCLAHMKFEVPIS